MYRDGDYEWERKFRKDWETLCLNCLGQEKYNETRKLKKDYMGICKKIQIGEEGEA